MSLVANCFFVLNPQGWQLPPGVRVFMADLLATSPTYFPIPPVHSDSIFMIMTPWGATKFLYHIAN